jgi:hypothetical protein
MEERRHHPRHRTFKAGTIVFNRAGGISCTVRNLSAAGANLDVASPVGIPDEFTLAIEHDHVTRSCHVIWRSGKRIGVTFDDRP